MTGALILLAMAGTFYEDLRWGFVIELPGLWSESPLPAKDSYATARFVRAEGAAEVVIIALPKLPDGTWLGYQSYIEGRGWKANSARDGIGIEGADWRGHVWIREFDDVHLAIQLRAPTAEFAQREQELREKLETLERTVIAPPDWGVMEMKPMRVEIRMDAGSPAPAWSRPEKAPDTTQIEVFYATTRERVGEHVGRMLAWLGGYLLMIGVIVLVSRLPAFHRVWVWCALVLVAAALFVRSTMDGFPLLFGAFALALPLVPPTLRCLLRRRWRWLVPITRGVLAIAALLMFALNTTRGYQTWDQQQRVKLAYGGGRAQYDGERDFETGICTVSIPENRDEGEIPLPLLGLPDPTKHFMIAGLDVLDAATFRRRLAERAANSDRKDALLFVHGYNNTFNDAAFRTAQIAHDLRFKGAPILFSWPSKGDFLRYSHDEAEVIPAGRALGRFLADLQETDGIEHLYVVAHSMGCRVLGLALQWMRAEGHDRPLDVIVLAAPDIDEEAFRTVIAPDLRKRTQRPTLYVSRNDSALKASYGFHGYRRAGDAGPAPIVIEGIDTIDVSRISADHSYIGSNYRVMSDLEQLLEHLNPATKRLGPESPLRFEPALGYYWIDVPR